MDPREYDWQRMGELARQDLYPDERGLQPPPEPRAGTGEEYAGLGGDPRHLATAIKDWWTGQPSWAEKARTENQKTIDAYQRGGMGEIARQMGDTVAAEDLVGGFGAGTIKPNKAPTGFAPGGILGIHPTSTAGAIHGGTLSGGGYSVHLPTGSIPTEGLMVGRYKNTDPRNMVVPRDEFTPASVTQHAETNVAALGKPGAHLGTWVGPDGKVYLDVAQQYPADKIRVATKAGERTGQLAGYNVGAGESFPIGSWRDFVSSPEFKARMDEMAKTGRDYLSNFANKEWWDMHGSSFERAYGEKNLPQVAGFSAATAPVSNPYDNMRAMSEYMRRHIKGEPTIQPDFRIPEGGMGPWSAGKQIPLEQSRIANLNKAAAGDLESLQRAKVREEAKAMTGDPSAVVLDRHWARLTEDPARGIFANAQPGVIDTAARKRGLGDYDFVKGHVSDAAAAAKRDPRDYSADVWTGIRETIKRTNQLFGTPFKGSAITGESKSYQDIFQELLERKAKHMGISTEALDKKLRSGDANLLSTMLATSPALWGAYQAWQSGEAPGSLAVRDQYQ